MRKRSPGIPPRGDDAGSGISPRAGSGEMSPGQGDVSPARCSSLTRGPAIRGRRGALATARTDSMPSSGAMAPGGTARERTPALQIAAVQVPPFSAVLVVVGLHHLRRCRRLGCTHSLATDTTGIATRRMRHSGFDPADDYARPRSPRGGPGRGPRTTTSGTPFARGHGHDPARLGPPLHAPASRAPRRGPGRALRHAWRVRRSDTVHLCFDALLAGRRPGWLWVAPQRRHG